MNNIELHINITIAVSSTTYGTHYVTVSPEFNDNPL